MKMCVLCPGWGQGRLFSAAFNSLSLDEKKGLQVMEGVNPLGNAGMSTSHHLTLSPGTIGPPGVPHPQLSVSHALTLSPGTIRPPGVSHPQRSIVP